MRQGCPTCAWCLLKGVDGPDESPRGFVFYTNLESAKGGELKANPRAALLFHWKSLERQVRARGPIAPVTAAEADAYFATRPRLSRIGAWASDQSRPLESRFALEKRVAAFDGQIRRRRGSPAPALVRISLAAARDRVLGQPAIPSPRSAGIPPPSAVGALAEGPAFPVTGAPQVAGGHGHGARRPLRKHACSCKCSAATRESPRRAAI